MAIPKFEDDLRIISKLGDNPGTDNGYTTQEFREAFDKAPLLIQKFINEVLIPAANASSSPEEGLSMKGPINMNGQAIKGLNAPTADDEAVNWGSVKDLGKVSPVTVTLAASGWVNNTQTVPVEGLTGDNIVFVGADTDSIDAYREADVKCKHDNNTLTFRCEDVPADSLSVNVVILGASGASEAYTAAEGGSF